MRRSKTRKYLLPALLIVFTLTFLVSAVFIVKYMFNSHQQKVIYGDLADMVTQVQQQLQQNQSTVPTTPLKPGEIAPPPPPAVSVFENIAHPVTGQSMSILKEYADIFVRNTDMVGWIRIPGTRLDYPVVQTPDSPNFYLQRDFYKNDSRHGTIYAAEAANINTPSDNVTLYGHNMNDGSMFALLHNYSKKEYYEQHPYIIFDTLTEHHTYQIFAVFETTDIPGEGFIYHTFVDGNPTSFAEYVANCKNLSLYDTGVTATFGDKLITLSTCDNLYWDEHGRYVVVAKRIA